MDHSFISLSSDEIETALQKASLFGGQVSYPTASRNETLRIEKIEMDKHGKISIKLSGDITMEEKWPVSVRLNYRDISFQFDPKYYSVHGNMLIGSLPRKARAIPERIGKRYILPYQSMVTASMYRIEKRGGSIDLNLKVIDFSKSGIAILIPDLKEENILLKNDHLWIKSINGFTLEKPIFATVVYASQRKFKDTIDLKAGLALDESLPGPLVRELQQLCNLVLPA